jgi:peroxiredoxin Q/BCP
MNLSSKYDILVWGSEILNISLSDLFKKADKTILYFYPKDNTPGCTIENKDFSCLKAMFDSLWIQLVWVSKDSIASHIKFVEKQELAVDLLSDPELELHNELWVYWEKMNYWKKYMWVIRSTFIINSNWEVLQEYRNVRAKWHAERIFKELS